MCIKWVTIQTENIVDNVYYNNSILVFEDADIIKSTVKDAVDSQSSQI